MRNVRGPLFLHGRYSLVASSLCENGDSKSPSADDSDGSSGPILEIASKTIVDCSPVWKVEQAAAKSCDKAKICDGQAKLWIGPGETSDNVRCKARLRWLRGSLIRGGWRPGILLMLEPSLAPFSVPKPRAPKRLRSRLN